MTKIVVDAALGARLIATHDLVELCDESGRTLGFFQPLAQSDASAGASVQSPVVEDEIEFRRRQPTGRQLSAIQDDLRRA